LFEQLRQLSEKHPEKMVGQLKVVAVLEPTPSPQVTDD
jgi:hypothetical protein